jgi:hypothetical protein
MNPAILRYSLIFASSVLGIAFAGEPAPTTVAPAPNSAVQQRIDALLKRRLRPEPLPVDLPNPFQANSGPRREISRDEVVAGDSNGSASVNAAKPAGPSPVEILASVSARFKIGGIITLKDQLKVVINGLPRGEGDSVAADLNGGLIFVKIIRLTESQMSLRYGDAEITMKF